MEERFLISEILESDSHLKEIDYNDCYDQDTIKDIVTALAYYFGVDLHDIQVRHVRAFIKAMRDGSKFLVL